MRFGSMEVEGMLVGEEEVKRLEREGEVVDLKVDEREVVEVVIVGREVYVIKGVEDGDGLYEVLRIKVGD